MTHQLHSHLAQARTDEMVRRAAERHRVAPTQRWSRLSAASQRAMNRIRGLASAPPRVERSTDLDVRIRFAFPDDAAALRRLAALDSAALLLPPVLVAEVDGELRAALSLVEGEVIADPFHLTGPFVELLHVRAAQLGVPGVAISKQPSATPTWRPALEAPHEGRG